MFVRIPYWRINEAEEALEEALRLVEDIRKKILEGFEKAIRSGVLEDYFERLATDIQVLLDYGFSNTRYAVERSILLSKYAHALRVRLRGKPEGQMLSREYHDFTSHLDYIYNVLMEVKELLSTIRVRGGGESSRRSR